MNDPLFCVQNKTVLVSGGTRGIGLALAKGFCQRGANVVLTGRDRETAEAAAAQLAMEQEACVTGIACDVSNRDDIRQTVDRILQQHGQLDVLFNVAGVNRRMPAEEVSEQDFDFVMDINLRGAFLMSQEVGKHMLARGCGHQINITSLNNDSPLHWMVPYAASKAALGQMTRALAMEWGPRGVRVNAIAPGFILSDFNQELWENETLQKWGEVNTPLVRLGSPDDLIGAAVFLASDASAFMTGQVLYVDGGFTAGWKWPIEEVMGNHR